MFNSFRSNVRALLVPAAAFAFAACGDDPVAPVDPGVTDDIVDIATSTGDVSTLAAALEAAGLVSALQGEGPFTVFAPVNSAFAALGTGVVDALLEDGNAELLSRILTFHVVAGTAAFSEDLTDGQTVTTLEGGQLTIGVSGGGVTVNGAAVTTADIEATNGVIHLIDEVLVPSVDIVDVATLNGFSTLTTAVGAAGLVDALRGDGPFTVFAPTNAAFDALGADVIAALLDEGNIDLLTGILGFHVVPGVAAFAGDLTDGQMVTTLEGEQLTIGVSGEGVTVNGVSVIAADVAASNGVIHVTDEVLVPSVDIVDRAILTAETQTLVAAVAAGDLVTTLKGDGPFTVFAPINEAFEALGTDQLDVLLAPENQALLQKILTYHVISGDVRAADLVDGGTATTVEGTEVTFDLSGETPMVNGANIIATDIVTENGVIHLIDGVLTENADIVDVATLNGFETLVALVAEANLVTTLRSDNGGDGFTVFAPTDEAFAALAAVPSGQDLVDVLTYHVVGATVGSGDLTDAQVVTTVEGSTFTVNIDGSAVSITDGSGNTVDVVLTDVPASNGVIHVIDGVLLPGS
jgi:transforming growth factor-beta-induced protein